MSEFEGRAVRNDDTYAILWMGFIYLSSSAAAILLETLHEVCGKRQGFPSNTPEFPEMLLFL